MRRAEWLLILVVLQALDGCVGWNGAPQLVLLSLWWQTTFLLPDPIAQWSVAVHSRPARQALVVCLTLTALLVCPVQSWPIWSCSRVSIWEASFSRRPVLGDSTLLLAVATANKGASCTHQHLIKQLVNLLIGIRHRLVAGVGGSLALARKAVDRGSRRCRSRLSVSSLLSEWTKEIRHTLRRGGDGGGCF